MDLGGAFHRQVEREVLDLVGRPDSTFVVEEFLRTASTCYNASGTPWAKTIFLNSNGGLITHGYKLGVLFKKNQVEAKIVGGQSAEPSACLKDFLLLS